MSMDYATFRKVYPATRCFQRHSSETRAMMASSFRLGRRQRQSVGEYFYTHAMIPDRAFSSAGLATTAAHAVYLEAAKTLSVDAVMGQVIDIAAALGAEKADALLGPSHVEAASSRSLDAKRC